MPAVEFSHILLFVFPLIIWDAIGVLCSALELEIECRLACCYEYVSVFAPKLSRLTCDVVEQESYWYSFGPTLIGPPIY